MEDKRNDGESNKGEIISDGPGKNNSKSDALPSNSDSTEGLRVVATIVFHIT